MKFIKILHIIIRSINSSIDCKQIFYRIFDDKCRIFLLLLYGINFFIIIQNSKAKFYKFTNNLFFYSISCIL
jgi:hypothetical protein